jgi:2-polyprenyl-3-methyl-5-hydroxy-6-metoxy-1,4-benzoquinol methylase
VILIINVLDHCSDPVKVLNEIDRCLKSSGMLILRIYTYSPIAVFIHSLFNFVDKEHPHAITQAFVKTKLADGYDTKEISFEKPKLPDYNILKKIVLMILKSLSLEPVALKVVAIKK